MKLLFTVLALVASSSAQAKTLTYFCESTDNRGKNQILKISLAAKLKKVSVTGTKDDSYDEANRFTAKYDPTYKPRGSTQKVRFIGTEANESNRGAKRQAILSTNLLTGAKKGYMQIRGDEDGYWSENFTCFYQSSK